jgi:hypothetical protein
MALAQNTTWARNGPLGMSSEVLARLLASGSFIRELANTWTIRGVLALEAGDPAKAEEYFDRGLRLVQTPAGETAFVGFYGIRAPLAATAFIAGRFALPDSRASFDQQYVANRYRSLLLSAKEQAKERQTAR